jgi:ADP-ribose pyrophosphatase YjhB (NUDIX family)
LGRLSGAEAVSVQNWLSLDSNYVTPKLDVRALVMRGDDVLLVQEREDGRWSLPGGWCDVHQSPGESVEKEVREETGLMVRASRLLALLDKRKHDYPMQIPHAYKCFFLCEEYGGALVGSTIEIGQAAFVPWTDLPPLSLHRVTRSQVETIVQIGKDPARATAFD